MGYLTKFTLTLPEHLTQKQVDFIFDTDCIEETPFSTTFYGRGHSRSSECIKWYPEHYEKELTQLSKMFPEVLFILDGEGEEAGDLWRMFFKNGLQERHVAPPWTPPTSPRTF